MNSNQNAEWKHPDELIKLRRLKQKQKALQARLNRTNTDVNVCDSNKEPGSVIAKRKNPFLKNRDSDDNTKKSKLEEFASEDTIFSLLQNNQQNGVTSEEPIKKIPSFNAQQPNPEYFQQPEEDEIHEDIKPSAFLPIDWCLKTKLRLLSKIPIPGNQLKTSQEASGLTSFVRCLDKKIETTGLDISPGAQFFQSTLYWEHPNLPWLTLFPRNSKLNNGFCALGDTERVALLKDWTNSFTSLFRLVRTRQCPYFYVCADSFTVLFRAAGIGGRVETHALLTPTTRGMRAALKEESIEFTLPLKKSLNDSSQNNSSSTLPEDNESMAKKVTDDDDDDEDAEDWLESLGLSVDEIKNIQSADSRKLASQECENDFSERSIALIEGFECQALFNFLLNAKSTVSKVGKLAGIPPTLLSPVAFQGATLKNLQARSSKIRAEGLDYFSMEIKGVILPHVLPYLNDLLRNLTDSFSATMTNNVPSLAFTKASESMIDDADQENNKSSDFVFGRENLSDCGMPSGIVEAMCRVEKDAIKILERIHFSKELGGFTWWGD